MKNSLLCLSLSTAAFFFNLEAKAFSAQERIEIGRNSLPSTNLLAQQFDRYSSYRQCMSPLLVPQPGMQGVAQDALVACDRALANYPNNTDFRLNDTVFVLQNRALALEVLGRYEEAIATYDRLIAIHPNGGYQSSRSRAVRELQRSSSWFPSRPSRVSDAQVTALAEALRLTIINTKLGVLPPGNIEDPVYSDWKLRPRVIAQVSRICAKRVVLPQEFAANSTLARSIIECEVRAILNEEYYQSGNNEFEAVRRAASMFWDSRPDYNFAPYAAEFSQRVLNFYRQLRSSSSPRS